MNVQHVGGDILQYAKTRLTELQELISARERNIQNVLDTYDEKKELAGRRSISRSEFDALYPTAPELLDENAKLTAKRTEHSELIKNYDPKNSSKIGQLIREINELETFIFRTTDDYHRTKLNPHRSLTDNEFLALYPAPADTEFAEARAEISAARDEINKLHLFLKSGTYPQPGNYDVDLLSGTVVAFP